MPNFRVYESNGNGNGNGKNSDKPNGNGNGNGINREKKSQPFEDALVLPSIEILKDPKLEGLPPEHKLYVRSKLAEVYTHFSAVDEKLISLYHQLKIVSDKEHPTFTDSAFFAMLCERAANGSEPSKRGFLYLLSVHALNRAINGGLAHAHAQMHLLAARHSMLAAVYSTEKDVNRMQDIRMPESVRQTSIKRELTTLATPNDRAFVAENSLDITALRDALLSAERLGLKERLFPESQGGIRGVLLASAAELARQAQLIPKKSLIARALDKGGEIEAAKLSTEIQRLQTGKLSPDEFAPLVEVLTNPKDVEEFWSAAASSVDTASFKGIPASELNSSTLKLLNRSKSHETLWSAAASSVDTASFKGIPASELNSFIELIAENPHSQPLISELRLALVIRLEKDLQEALFDNNKAKIEELSSQLEKTFSILKLTPSKVIAARSATLAANHFAAEVSRKKSVPAIESFMGSVRLFFEGLDARLSMSGQPPKTRGVGEMLVTARVYLDSAIESLADAKRIDPKTRGRLEIDICEAYVQILRLGAGSEKQLFADLLVAQQKLRKLDYDTASLNPMRRSLMEVGRSIDKSTRPNYERARRLSDKLQQTLDVLLKFNDEDDRYLQLIAPSTKTGGPQHIMQISQEGLLRYISARYAELNASDQMNFEIATSLTGGLSKDERQELAKLLSAQH